MINLIQRLDLISCTLAMALWRPNVCSNLQSSEDSISQTHAILPCQSPTPRPQLILQGPTESSPA